MKQNFRECGIPLKESDSQTETSNNAHTCSKGAMWLKMTFRFWRVKGFARVARLEG